jgi:DNA-binding NtrC family response regulator
MLADLAFLIVDDDESTISTLSLLLARLGAINISVARSGYEAFTLIAKTRERFDYVISDVCMAEGNGLELLYQIRTTTATQNFRPDMCVILMSGMASTDIAFVASRLDVNAFLVKPFSITKLQSVISVARRRTFPLNRNNYYKIGADKLQVA